MFVIQTDDDLQEIDVQERPDGVLVITMTPDDHEIIKQKSDSWKTTEEYVGEIVSNYLTKPNE